MKSSWNISNDAFLGVIAAILSLIRPGQVDLGSQREVKNNKFCYTQGWKYRKLIFEKLNFGTSIPSYIYNIIEFKDVISRTSPNYERL